MVIVSEGSEWAHAAHSSRSAMSTMGCKRSFAAHQANDGFAQESDFANSGAEVGPDKVLTARSEPSAQLQGMATPSPGRAY